MPTRIQLCSCCALLLLAACQGDTASRAGGTDMKCVNQVMDSNELAPTVVVLTNHDFHQRFGSAYDGWYDGGNDTVYLSSHRDGSLLPHELAHHVQHQKGGFLNEAQARQVARLCS